MTTPTLPLRCTTDFNPSDTLRIRPWLDDVIDALGFDPRSQYVETFWLSQLGPSTTWFMRRVAAGLDQNPGGYTLVLGDTAQSLGLSESGRRKSAFVRAVTRTIKFGLAYAEGPDVLRVRRRLPPLSRCQIEHLPDALRAAHDRWQEEQLQSPGSDRQRRQARLLALSMIEMGDELDAAERRLAELRYHPGLAHDAATWAWARHRAALAAAG